MSTATPVQVLESIVTGINTGDLDSLLPLYEREAAFATGIRIRQLPIGSTVKIA